MRIGGEWKWLRIVSNGGLWNEWCWIFGCFWQSY
jgi:hypothetical protein